VNKFKKIVAVASVGILFLLTGCSSSNSAATVGKTDIPNSTVQGSINDILKERTTVDTKGMNLVTGVDLNTNAIRFHVVSVLFDDVANKIKMTVTDAEIAERRKSIIAQIGSEKDLASALVNAQIAKKDFPRYIRTILIAEKLSSVIKSQGDTSTDGSGIQKLLVGMGKEEKVKLNPRYGVWDYDNANVVPAADNATVKK